MSSILWQRLDRPGHEAARLSNSGGHRLLDGCAVFEHEGESCRLQYAITCNAGWKTVSARVEGWVGNLDVQIVISVDGNQRWTMNGSPADQVAGCLDVDLNFSPSTNLLPIRRLGLAVGDQATVSAAWLRFPSFKLELLEQIYRRESDDVYSYESGGGLFRSRINVNAEGFVTHYPGFWQAGSPKQGGR